MQFKLTTATVALLSTFVGVFSLCASAGTITTLISFDGANGSAPVSSLTLGKDGNLYGTTDGGGLGFKGKAFSGYGTVFRITPAGAFTSLAKFTLANGATPNGRLVLGRDGNFYGTATMGGSAQAGAIYKVTPAGTLSTLVTFTGANGSFPSAGLVLGADGNFYGTTIAGGAGRAGTLFRVTPAGALTTLASFGGDRGSKPAQLVVGNDGALFGTTLIGGTANQGLAFKATPTGTVTTLTSFNFASGKGDHYTTLMQDRDGIIYGASSWGGASNQGSVLKMAPNGTLTILASFNGTNGALPDTVLTKGSDGIFYGTTTAGGANNKGTVFSVTPTGTLTTVASFDGTNGVEPYGAVVQISNDFYGTTQLGGAHGFGTVFKLRVK
jgi:uncharacterized repeat protein (TIGR03803 family)